MDALGSQAFLLLLLFSACYRAPFYSLLLSCPSFYSRPRHRCCCSPLSSHAVAAAAAAAGGAGRAWKVRRRVYRGGNCFRRLTMGAAATKEPGDSHLTRLLQAKDAEELQNDQEFWDGFFATELQLEDTTAIVKPEIVRQLMKERPDMAVLLFTKLVDCLSAATAIGFSEATIPQTVIARMLTALRLLTTIMPYALEDSEAEDQVFWQTRGPPIPCAGHEAIKEGAVPLALTILEILSQLLFLNSFTVVAPGVTFSQSEPFPRHSLDPRLLWRGGVGSSSAAPERAASAALLQHRVVVLRCLIVSFSGGIYKTTAEYQKTCPRWMAAFTGGGLSFTANTLCSLLSFTLNRKSQKSVLPLASLFSTSDESTLSRLCLQLLVAALDFAPYVFDAQVIGVVHRAGSGGPLSLEAEEKLETNVTKILGEAVRRKTETLHFVPNDESAPLPLGAAAAARRLSTSSGPRPTEEAALGRPL
eukprot:GHVT01039019.1.p1 GENE.GHVT01039019.1~~GHVT01039019.1.p1  ORF type:complete len:474 (+),score=110.50 GHVT01039019.1:243-1664(+)